MSSLIKTIVTVSGFGLLLAGCASSQMSYVSPTASPLAPTSAPSASPFSVALKPLNNSGQPGTAEFTDVGGGKTSVTLSIKGKTSSVAQPAHIHTGTCAKPGNVLYPLTAVVNGKSETIVNASIEAIKANGQTLVNVHKSEKEMSVYTSCGELPASKAVKK